MIPKTIKAISNTNALDRLLAAGNLALIAVTWPLWIPQTVFPQVPLVSIAGRLPHSIEWGLLLLLLLSLCGVFFVATRNYRRYASLTAGLSTLALVCIDQHRLQPWAWQFVIVSFVLATAESSSAVATVWRWLVIGIYAWSAWSKMDYGFCVQHGPFLLDGLCHSIGFTNGTRTWPQAVRLVVAGSIPVFEFSVAVGLCWLRTRRVALVGSTVMHVGLLLALGPLGHRHQPGVLVWNVFFLVQNWLLFNWDPTSFGSVESKSVGAEGGAITGDFETEGINQDRSYLSSPSYSVVTDGGDSRRNNRNDQIGGEEPRHMECACHFGNALSRFVVIAALLWPFFEPFGLCDHWPAWAVYAAKPERVIVFLDESELPKLPESMQRFLGSQTVLNEWYPVRIDRWSLDSLHVPIYPQDRFQIGVALGMIRRFDLTRIRIVVEGPANRWSGSRVVNEYSGVEAVEVLADSYRLGAQPR